MKTSYAKLFPFFFMAAIAILLSYSCSKNSGISGKIAMDTYINNTGKDMTIKKYKAGKDTSYIIATSDTLIIHTPWDTGADTTGSMFYADSARVIFSDAKTYVIVSDTTLKTNFLQRKNFVQSISPGGQTYYFRYTFSSADYALAK
jgi:hypothetical protein